MHFNLCFVSKNPAPFWIELFNYLSETLGFEVLIIFQNREATHRGDYWNLGSNDKIKYFDEVDTDYYSSISIEHLLFAGLSVRDMQSIKRNVKKYHKSIIIMEQPDQEFALIKRLKYYRFLKEASPDLILGIGNDAASYYDSLKTKIKVRPFRYFQNHNIHLNNSCNYTKKEGLHNFIFAGRLIKRNRIRDICAAIVELLNLKYKFNFIFSGEGPEKDLVEELIKHNEAFSAAVTLQSEFQTWSDRLRPVMESDTLLCVPDYSNWGLVVPEAISCDTLVISTLNTLAAKQYIDHLHNGFLIDLNFTSILETMITCIENPELHTTLRANAQKSVMHSDVSHGAHVLENILKYEL